jgi:hypothetical protein
MSQGKTISSETPGPEMVGPQDCLGTCLNCHVASSSSEGRVSKASFCLQAREKEAKKAKAEAKAKAAEAAAKVSGVVTHSLGPRD